MHFHGLPPALQRVSVLHNYIIVFCYFNVFLFPLSQRKITQERLFFFTEYRQVACLSAYIFQDQLTFIVTVTGADGKANLTNFSVMFHFYTPQGV